MRYEDLVERKQALALAVLQELGLRPTAAAAAPSAAGDELPDEDAVVAQGAVEAAFATDAHQGGNAFLAGKRARDKEGRLLSNDGPLYFPAAEVADLVRFMQLHEVLGVTDPYCQLPKTVR